MKLILLLICGVLFGLAHPMSLAGESPTLRAEQEGLLLATDARSRIPVEASEHAGKLKLRDADGKRGEIPVLLSIKTGERYWETLYSSVRQDGSTEQLVIRHDPLGTNQFFLTVSASTNKESNAPSLAPISGKALFQPFAGSDFWLVDLGMDFLFWPNQKLIRREMTKSRPCRVLESTNPNAEPGTYARVLSWLDAESSDIIKAQAYDHNNRLLKKFFVNSLKKVNGKWELREIEIRNEQTDSVTRLEFSLQK